MPSLADMPPYEVYSRVARDATRNVFMELVGTAFVYWLTGIWRLGAQILFWLFVGITVIEIVQLVVTHAAGLVAWVALKRKGDLIEDGQWLRRAGYVRTAAVLIATALLYALYRHIW